MCAWQYKENNLKSTLKIEHEFMVIFFSFKRVLYIAEAWKTVTYGLASQMREPKIFDVVLELLGVK